ncbi:cell division cycle protein 16 homolog [Epargyreus clarus]|uniref:cell division cycle protein 16 homolog n=1 Tax=Epargyreus clarus TaxID=520877 RepID=UPI003C2B175F
MSKAETAGRGNGNGLNVEFMRSLVKQYSELGQWTSAFFWADAAAASSGADTASGDDIWLLASAMLARGELHRAAHAVTSRGLHERHLLCLGVAMRAYIQAKEPSTALNLLDECDPNLLEPRNLDQTHNRALAGILVWQARALSLLERREAAAVTLTLALRTDCACYEALDLLLEQHALTPRQESELIESLPLNSQLGAGEAALLRAAYRERLLRYTPLRATPPTPQEHAGNHSRVVDIVRSKSAEAAESRGRRLAADGSWAEALRVLDSAGPWSCAEVRAACLVELGRSSELFAFAHALVDAYPQSWTSWYAVGCYYYLIGKTEFARRYLSKAWALCGGAGCVWLAYGHSFAADNEHDQAMAAYFKASQLMAGCALPPLYVGVECAALNNASVCERFMARAAALHRAPQSESPECAEGAEGAAPGGWERIARVVQCPHVAHEAGAAAFAAGDAAAARALWLRALDAAGPPDDLAVCWAATLDALGHAARALGRPAEALRWHERALALRPARAASLAARGLCLALLGREPEAADALHAALARDPDDVVALALLDAIVDRLDAALTEEEIPQFPFPALNASVTATPPGPPAPPATPPGADATNTSDMSMSFD